MNIITSHVWDARPEHRHRLLKKRRLAMTADESIVGQQQLHSGGCSEAVQLFFMDADTSSDDEIPDTADDQDHNNDGEEGGGESNYDSKLVGQQTLNRNRSSSPSRTSYIYCSLRCTNHDVSLHRPGDDLGNI
ncbi:unnamed protein product [Ectocarpus sp. 6 AP-2014]